MKVISPVEKADRSRTLIGGKKRVQMRELRRMLIPGRWIQINANGPAINPLAGVMTPPAWSFGLGMRRRITAPSLEKKRLMRLISEILWWPGLTLAGRINIWIPATI